MGSASESHFGELRSEGCAHPLHLISAQPGPPSANGVADVLVPHPGRKDHAYFAKKSILTQIYNNVIPVIGKLNDINVTTEEAKLVYGSTDDHHPGVYYLYNNIGMHF